MKDRRTERDTHGFSSSHAWGNAAASGDRGWKRNLIFLLMDADGVQKKSLVIPAVWCDGE
jgi:hypothetical protein